MNFAGATMYNLIYPSLRIRGNHGDNRRPPQRMSGGHSLLVHEFRFHSENRIENEREEMKVKLKLRSNRKSVGILGKSALDTAGRVRQLPW